MNFPLEKDTLRLALTLMTSGLEIIESDGDKLEIVYPELRKKTAEDLFSVRFEENTIFIKEKNRKRLNKYASLFDENLNTDLVLKIPSKIMLKGSVTTLSGHIKIGSFDFTGRIKSLSSSIDLDKINSSGLDINSVSGSVRMTYLNGPLKCGTISGGVLLEGGNLSDLSIKTASGDISLNTSIMLDEDGEIRTVSGDIQLNISAYDTDRMLYLSTLNGSTKIDGEYPEEKIQMKRRMPFLREFPFGNVMPAVKDVISRFSSMRHGPNVEVHTQSSTRSDDKNIEKVLEMLSEGKISPEEAEKLIRTIRG